MSDRNMTAGEVVALTLPPSSHIEVRQKQNGTWSVFYPDPGWIPCPPNCQLGLHGVMRGHKHDYTQSWIESTYKPVDYDDAMDWGAKHASGREVKVVSFVPLHQRKKQALTEDEA